MYLTVFALFLIVICALTGGIEIYSYGIIHITNPTLFAIAIILVIFDFIYEVAKFLFKLSVKQEEKQAQEKPKETSS